MKITYDCPSCSRSIETKIDSDMSPFVYDGETSKLDVIKCKCGFVSTIELGISYGAKYDIKARKA